MSIKRYSEHEKANNSTHHKSMSEQDADRLLEEISLSKNAVEKEYIKAGKLYNHKESGKQMVVVNNENMMVENVKIYDNRGFYNFEKNEPKGLFFNPPESFFKSDEFGKTLTTLQKKGYISINQNGDVMKRFGILAVGEYGATGEMLGTKLTVGFKNDMGVVEPFSDVFFTGAGRTTGSVVISNGVKKQATMVATETIRGKVIADASATEFAKAVTIGFKGLMNSEQKNLLEYYIKDKSYENEFFPFLMNEVFEKYQEINTVTSDNIVRTTTSMLEGDYTKEKFFGTKKAISYNFYKNVFGASSKKSFNANEVLSFNSATKQDQVAESLAKVKEAFSTIDIQEKPVQKFNENLGKFLINTDLVKTREEWNESLVKETFLTFTDEKAEYIVKDFSKYLSGKASILFNDATENTKVGKETFDALKKVIDNFSIQDSFVEYLTSKNSNTKINISTLLELSKSTEDETTVKKISNTIKGAPEPEMPSSFMVRSSVYEKVNENSRSFLMNKDITKTKKLNLIYNLNKDFELEVNAPLILFNEKNNEYYYRNIKIKTNNDAQEFRTKKIETEFAYNTTITKAKAKLVNDTNAQRRAIELSFENEGISKIDPRELNVNFGNENDLETALHYYNKEDVFRLNVYGSQTGVMAGKAYAGSAGSGSNTALAVYGDHRQPLAQGQNVMFTQNINGVNVTDTLIDNYVEKESLNERTLIKGKPFVTEEQLRLEQETEKRTGSIKSRNNITGYGFYLSDDTTWQENMVITKELKNKAFFSGEQSLTVRFNQINDNFFSLKEVTDIGVTKQNISSVFKSDEEKAKKIISLLITENFNKKIENANIFKSEDAKELQKAAELYEQNPAYFLVQKEKNGKAILLNKEYLNKAANIGVKADFGVAYNGYEFDDDSFKIKLNKIKIADEGSKIAANGSKGTIANVFDKITAVSGDKSFAGILTFNAKSENRKQAGLELYNILRTSLYNLSETNEKNYNNFLEDDVIKQTLKTFGLSVEKDTKTIKELYYNNDSKGYDKFIESFLDYQSGKKSGVMENGSFENGIKKLSTLLTGKSDTPIDLAEIATGILGKYEEYGKQNGAHFEPILIRNAIMFYEKNGTKLKSAAQNIYRFVTSITRPSVTETKTIEGAVNLDASAIRLLREKGQKLFAQTVEDMIYDQALNKEEAQIGKFLMYGDEKINKINPKDYGNFVEAAINENKDELIKINFSEIGETEIKKLADKEYITAKSFFNTTVGKIIEKEELLEGEELKKNVVTIVKSEKVKNYMQNLKEEEPKSQIDFKKFKENIVEIVENNAGKEEREAKLLAYFQANYEDAIKNENYRIYNYSTKDNSHLRQQYRALFDGEYVGISNINEIAIDKENKIISNEGINVLKRWARAEESVKTLDSKDIIENVIKLSKHQNEELTLSLIQKELDKPVEALKNIYNLVDKTTIEMFKKDKGSLSKNLTTMRIKNSFMAAPANNDLIFQAFANNVYHKDFESHLKDFFGDEIAKKLNDFERVEFKNGDDALSAISQTKENFIKKLKELNDVVITRKEMVHDNLNLKESFTKTMSGIERTFGKYVGYPLQTVANLSSSLLIMFDNNSENIFAKEMIKAGFMDNDKAKQLFFLNKKTWFKALRDFDGDKAQYMFNVLKDYKTNKNLVDNFILRDQYEFFVKNGIDVPQEMLNTLNISKSEHEQHLFIDKFRERWYDMKLKKEMGKHDLYTQDVIAYFLDKSVNENISVSESIKSTYENLLSKYDFKNEKFLQEMSDEEMDIFNKIQKSRRFKIFRSTPLHSIEQAKNTLKTLTGIKDTGKIHSGVTQFRKLIGNIAFGEFNEEFEKRIGTTGIGVLRQTQNKIKNSFGEFSEVAGMLIEDGAISAKHGQNAIVPSLIKAFENEIKTSYSDKDELKLHWENSKKIYAMSNVKTVDEYDRLYSELTNQSKNVLEEISDFLNSSMGAGFDISKNEFEHKKLAASILSEVTEVGNFINTVNHFTYVPKQKKFFSKKKQDLLYTMESTNNIFSKTARATDEEIHELITESIDNNQRKKPFENNFVSRFMEKAGKKYEERKVEFNFTRAFDSLSSVEDLSIESIKEGNNAENMVTLIKSIRSDTIPQEAIFDITEDIMKIKGGTLDTTSGIKALNEFSKLLNSGGVVMEGAAIHAGEKTLNITERTFGIIKKMIK